MVPIPTINQTHGIVTYLLMNRSDLLKGIILRMMIFSLLRWSGWNIFIGAFGQRYGQKFMWGRGQVPSVRLVDAPAPIISISVCHLKYTYGFVLFCFVEFMVSSLNAIFREMYSIRFVSTQSILIVLESNMYLISVLMQYLALFIAQVCM